MAECVSCGKDVPAGKFFCDDCYVKMKGRRGTLKEVSRASPAGPEEAPGGEGSPGGVENVGEPAVPVEIVQIRRASGALTPASNKKVVALKAGTDKGAREKGKTEKKRFTVTITFSERTYTALSRLKRKKDPGASPQEEKAAASKERIRRSAKAVRRSSPYGRARLRAVAGVSGAAAGRKSGAMKYIGYRDREWDRGDWAAAVTAAVSVLLILILSFMPWARLSWSEGEGASIQAVRVTGFDLGAMVYICNAVAVAALLYMLAAWLFKGPFAVVDYGVVWIFAGVVSIILFYASIASSSRMIAAALERAGRGGSPATLQFERLTLWPAYVIVLSGAALAFSGLIRLTERRNGREGEGG